MKIPLIPALFALSVVAPLAWGADETAISPSDRLERETVCAKEFGYTDRFKSHVSRRLSGGGKQLPGWADSISRNLNQTLCLPEKVRDSKLSGLELELKLLSQCGSVCANVEYADENAPLCKAACEGASGDVAAKLHGFRAGYAQAVNVEMRKCETKLVEQSSERAVGAEQLRKVVLPARDPAVAPGEVDVDALMNTRGVRANRGGG